MKRDYTAIGNLIKTLREQRDLGQRALGYSDRHVRELEAGRQHLPRAALIRMLVNNLQITDLQIINKALEFSGYAALISKEIDQNGLLISSDSRLLHEPQEACWGPTAGMPAGIICYQGNQRADFVPWADLKKEVEEKLLNQIGKHIPVNCRAVLDDFQGRHDWLCRIQGVGGSHVGDLWFGTNAERAWRYDGLIRAGKEISTGQCEVWQVFRRYSDGTYARIRVQTPCAT
jgi:transcriptional regulator with XRE-family HTH domain